MMLKREARGFEHRLASTSGTYVVALHAAEAVLKHEALNEEANQENQSNPVVQELLLHLVFLVYSRSLAQEEPDGL